MILRLLACLLFISPALRAQSPKPFHVLSLSGTASLGGLQGEAWPLEAGQDLPLGVSLSLTKGALISLRAFDRIGLLIAGPAQLQFIPVTASAESAAFLRLDSGSCYVDPRFLLGKPSLLSIQLPDQLIELKGGLPFMLEAQPKRSLREEVAAGKASKHHWPAAFLAAALEPVPVLVLCRDYDKELKIWPRPSVLGPAMLDALKGVPGLSLVDGSGTTTLAYYANHALRSGQDDFLQQLGRDHGARFVLVGNLVTEELSDESPSLRRHPLMSGVAELRVLETFPGGEVVVSDVATTLNARAGRPLEIAGREALWGAAQRSKAYLRADFEELLLGQPHVPQLLKLSFDHVSQERYRELRRGLGGMDTLQRYFKRSFAGGVLKMDVVLRKTQDDFTKQLKKLAFPSFSLVQGNPGAGGGLAFTLQGLAHPQAGSADSDDGAADGR